MEFAIDAQKSKAKRPARHIGGVFFALCVVTLMSACQSVPLTGVGSSPVASLPAPVPGNQPQKTEPQPEKPQPASAPRENGVPSITAKAAILVDHRGNILFQKNADMRLPCASTQKLLLGILIADAGDLNQTVSVSSADTHCEPTKMGIQPGQVYRKGDLLHAVLVRSSNDIARCLARNHSGSIPAFAAAMNAKARQLGMYNSHFTNASGLPTPAGQYSTCRDLAILGHAAMRRPVIREAVGTKAMVFRFSNGKTKTIYNTNQVLRSNPYCTGCKTGYTNAAGRCLVSSASDGRRAVIAVILGSKTPNVWTESDALLRYGLSKR